MNCPKCNFEVSGFTKFCPECGEKMPETLVQEIQSSENTEAISDEAIATTETNTKKSCNKKFKCLIIIGAAVVAILTIVLVLTLVVFKKDDEHTHHWVYETATEATYRYEGVQKKICRGCGASEKIPIPRKSISDLISNISDSDSCYKAAYEFFALSEEDQENVRNTYSLISSMKKYSSDVRIRDYLMKHLAKEEFNWIRTNTINKLLNPNSYIQKDITNIVFYDESIDTYFLYVTIEYSAQNQAGGYSASYTNNYFAWDGDSWVQTVDIDLIRKINNWQLPVYTRYNFT